MKRKFFTIIAIIRQAVDRRLKTALYLIPVAFFSTTFIAPVYAAVNDILPGDYYPGKVGNSAISIYAYHRKQIGPYKQKNKQANGKIGSSILAARLTHNYLIKNMLVTGVAVLPWFNSKVEPKFLSDTLGKETTGFSDLRLGATAWLINDPLNANYLALGSMLIAPTGHYNSNQLLNNGENRWKLVVSGGWQKDITRQWLVEFSPEIVWYGENNEFAGNKQLKQKPSYALTTYLRSRIKPRLHLFLGSQINRGGETQINGIDQHNSANNTRLMAGFSWFLPNKQQIILRAAKDISIENGFRTEQEIVLRYQKSF